MINSINNHSKVNLFPLITVGVTCYNAAETISRAIDSVFTQDWPNLKFSLLMIALRMAVVRLLTKESIMNHRFDSLNTPLIWVVQLHVIQ